MVQHLNTAFYRVQTEQTESRERAHRDFGQPTASQGSRLRSRERVHAGASRGTGDVSGEPARVVSAGCATALGTTLAAALAHSRCWWHPRLVGVAVAGMEDLGMKRMGWWT
jgi:hypothetical protein